MRLARFTETPTGDTIYVDADRVIVVKGLKSGVTRLMIDTQMQVLLLDVKGSVSDVAALLSEVK